MTVRTLDLFHGAGGSSVGALAAGADIVAGVDYWDIATSAYKSNFPNVTAINADIRKIIPRRLHGQIGDIELILASPECTNHSCAKGAALRDEQSRLTAFQVTRFAQEFRPKWIIVENVVQMNSWGRHQDLLNELNELGYSVRQEIFNAKDFGVPQSRRRLFLICSQIEEVPKITHPSRRKMRMACDIIDLNGKYAFTSLFSPKRAAATIERAERAFSALGKKEPFLIVYYGTDGSGGWQPIDEPLRTITTLDRFAFVKPSKTGHLMRMLQPEELKLAMGFPASYKLGIATRRDKVKLMGNAVCPPVMKHLVKSLIASQSCD
ncbi:MAG: DNA cytosine methyltransferase [Chloroflexi bacterium]|nr:DNA cytosine methyltransferase [Chloroflexota bacterium]